MSQYPQINAGTTPTIAVLQAMLPLAARKGSDQSVTSSTTLVNDSALVLPVAANATYAFQLTVLYKGNTAGSGDLKPGWSVPSGCVIAASTAGVNTTLNSVWGLMTQSSSNPAAFGTNGTGNPLSFLVSGTFTTSATAGSLQFQWAQNTSNATSTTVMAGSLLIARRTA